MIKKISLFFFCLAFLIMFTGCNDVKEEDAQYEIYMLASEAGYTGTYEEWLNSIKGKDGENGKSAYEIALENGFKGTVTEWLTSLEAQDGENGKDGKSAYEIALENGFEGTVTEWLTSLEAQDGIDGISIKSAKINEDGYLVIELSNNESFILGDVVGEDGQPGKDGEDGKDGHTPVITIENGYWYVDGVNTFVLAEGKNGVDGNGIKSIKLTLSKDDEDIYTIYFTNGEETTFSINKQNTSSNTTIKHLEFLEKKDGYVLPSTSVGKEVLFGSFSTHSKYLLPAYVNVTIIMKTGGSYGFARTDKSNIIIESCSNGNYGYYTFKALDYDTYLYVSDVKVSEIKEYNSLKDGSSYWSGKNIWWCGTSIPAGGYPLLVGEKLGANVYQEAVGGSMLRANVSTGDYNGTNISNITSSLSMTLDEANSFIENYDNLHLLDKNGSWPEVLSESYKKRILSGTFETKLLPYLTGQKPMPDLFVIDHGHNDWKYRDQNGNIDIELEPTVENIENGLLKEDTYMTMNNYENLKKYFGDLSNIPEDKFDDFVASINRNCYKGAMNFILTLILSHNPHARVVFISNYEYKNGINPGYANVIDAQVSLANEWCFPIFEIYKYLGYSDKIIPGTKDYMNENYPNQNFDEDVSVYEIYNVDKVHPSSDTTGFANDIYAELIAQFLENVR